MITVAAATLSILLGVVYMSYGTMTAIEMTRNRSELGFSHFGMAWIAVTFTCGPHHLIHGVHLGFEGRQAELIDLIVIAAAVPAGIVWFGLRLEAFFGGRGDRFISGTPLWIGLLPPLAAAYVTAVAAGLIGAGAIVLVNLEIAANLVLALLYVAIAFYIARTQIANRRALNGWSLSGVTMATAFSGCILMHGMYAFQMATGFYGPDVHNHWVDLLGVPATAYFLWVIRALNRGTYRDWNGLPGRRAQPGGIGSAPAGAGA